MVDLPNDNVVLGGLAACAVGLVSVGLVYAYFRRDRRKYEPVGVVSHLFVHPIKSCRGWEVNQTECINMGIEYDGVMDRSFMIVDDRDVFVHARKFPSLTLVEPSLSDDKQNLLINASGMPTLTVPLKGHTGELVRTRVWNLNATGVDCGKEAAEWFNKYLGTQGYRLIQYDDKRAVRFAKDDARWGSYAKSHEKLAYTDLDQVTILGEGSLKELNTRLDKTVTLRNFRPNIVVDTSTPFVEDRWKYVRIGDRTTLRLTHKSYRCRLTTIDPDKGEFIPTGDPLKKLREFRMAKGDDPDVVRYGQGPLFGTSLAVERVGTIKVGDVVYAATE